MAVTIEGDKEFENIPSIKSKALRINLNQNIYGTFAEIGAGQETVRNFFRAGGASGTIGAKLGELTSSSCGRTTTLVVAAAASSTKGVCSK